MHTSFVTQQISQTQPFPGLLLQVRHKTSFVYDGPATDSFNDVRLCPITDPLQRCEYFSLQVNPETPIHTYHDFFFNRVDHFELPEPHDTLDVESLSVVQTKPDARPPLSQPIPPQTLNDPTIPENYFDFLTDSHFVTLDAEVWRVAIDVLPDGVTDLWGDALKLGRHVHGLMTYASGATNVHTRMIDALRDRSGVCQDYAHIMLALCRTQGIPARYVSGYFFNEFRREDEVEASHAWVEIFLPGHGWKGYDPTHDRLADTRYLKLAVGRDYADIRPISGTFRGRGTQVMQVEVQVTLAK